MEWLGFTHSEAEAIWLTVKVATISSFAGLPVALFIAWLLARKNFPGKIILEGLINMPLVAPPVVTGYLLLLLFGRKGFFGIWLEQLFGIRLAFSFSALIIASVVVSLPLAVRTIKSAFQLVDKSLEEAARTLGASSLSAFFRITIPLALPGILSGMVLTFARSIGEFGATITFAGNIPGKTQTISTMVFSFMQSPGQDMATLRLVIISVFISIMAIISSEYIQKRKKMLIR